MAFRPVINTDRIRQSDPWGIAGGLLLLSLFFALVVLPEIERTLPNVSPRLLVQIIIFLVEVAVVLHCATRYGRVRLAEMIPRGPDYFVLIVAILVLFWTFGLTVGPARLSSKAHDEIIAHSVWQFWLFSAYVVIFAPLLEETFFRRYFLEILRHRYKVGIAALITVGVATLFHLGIPIVNLLWSVFYQTVFTVVYLNSRLGVAVVNHSFVNTLYLLLSQ